MIHVGMGQQDKVDACRVKAQGGFVSFGTHLKAAINQNFEPVAQFQQVHAAGDLLSRSPGGKCHGHRPQTYL
jgi:hypothetical protein